MAQNYIGQLDKVKVKIKVSESKITSASVNFDPVSKKQTLNIPQGC